MTIIVPKFDHYRFLPPEDSLINPLMDIPSHLKEENELTEFYKLCNEYYSPEFGIKYLMNFNLFPFQMAIVRAILKHKFPLLLLSRGSGKTTMLAVYAIYHSIMFPGSRIVLVSASFRQSKLIFAEIDRIYNSSPLLRAIAEDQPRISTDHCKFAINGSTIKALPLGTGDKIRGERGHVILADEFNSIPVEVFDVVVRGFAATQSDPWEKTRTKILEDRKSSGLKEDSAMADYMLAEGNRIVLSGTAGFKNGTFYQLYSQYSKILGNKVYGKVNNYKEIFKNDIIDDQHEIDYRDYCIIKMSYLDLPEGLLDIKVINHAKATMPSILFNMEYMSDFADDSFGFFKMKDIEAATDKTSSFFVLTSGNKNRQYVMGVDPAKTYDRFAIVLIELGSPNKIVYCWTQEKRTYSSGAKQIRELMRKFNVVAIAMDVGGGGLAVEELINKSEIMEEGEQHIFRNDSEEREAEKGLKNLYMFNFGSSTWLDEANSLLLKNIEDRVIMFPYPQVEGEFSSVKDDVLFEINEMKQELVAIDVTYTKTGRKHFDLAPPDLTKDNTNLVKFKDRYSALLLANYLVTRFNSLTKDDKAVIRKIYNQSANFGGWAENISGRNYK